MGCRNTFLQQPVIFANIPNFMKLNIHWQKMVFILL